MYDRYICPLQPCRHLTLKLLIQGHPQSAEVTHIVELKSALLLVLEVCDGKPTHRESYGVVGIDLGPLIQGQIRIAKLKSAYNPLIFGPRGLGW